MRTNKLLTTLAVASVVLIGGCNEKTDLNLSPGMSSEITSAALPMPQPVGKGAVNLGVAGDFAILSTTGITDVYPSVITGNIGTSAITGAAILVKCDEVTGTIYAVDAAYPDPTCLKVTIDASKLGTAVDNMLTC